MRPGDRVGVAVSGGADSVALLRLLLDARAELGIVLAVVHFNHKIRGADADADEQFVRELAAQSGLEFFSGSADTPAYAAAHKLSLEAAARQLRYGFFDELTAAAVGPGSPTREHGSKTRASYPGRLQRVATAHTRDDQAETVLLRLLRGAGPTGLAGIYPGIGGWVGWAKASVPPSPRIVRPLLEIARAELREYLGGIVQTWREDASNRDLSFARNRLRHEIMPLLRQLNPNLDAVLSDTAEIVRAEEAWWDGVLARPQTDSFLRTKDEPGSRLRARLKVEALRAQPLAVQRRLLRVFALAAGLRLEFKHVEELRALAADLSQRAKHLELPDSWNAVRAGQELWLERRCSSDQPGDYELALLVPGQVEIPQTGMKITAALAASGERLDLSFACELRVRNWRAGDRYRPAHTAAPKKLKELLQARHIPRAHKALWPVVTTHLSPEAGEKWDALQPGEEVIVWVPGFPLPEAFRLRDDATDGVLLSQLPLQPGQRTGP